MGKTDVFKLMVSYMKRHAGTFGMLGLFCIIFSVVFYLSSLPVGAVAYAALLCGCAGLLFLIFRFVRYYKRHKLLCRQLDCIALNIDGLPAPRDIPEQDYQNLIRAIHTNKTQLVSENENAKSEMIDYYTLWAHQIKTPIAAMGLLLQSEGNEQNAELAAELFKIEQYVEMVLGFLRLDSASTDFVLKKYDLDSIVRQTVRKYAKLFILKKINLDYTALNCAVLTDEKWLAFVVEQILSNALKYTNEGKISIYMQAKTLVIEDTGIGISDEDLPRVFEKGFTGYNGRIDKKSTGIGLYLCRRILTKLSHTIAIESKTGVGTKVKIGLDTADTVSD